MAESAALIGAIATAVTAAASVGSTIYQGISASDQQSKAEKTSAAQKQQQDQILKDKDLLSEQQRLRDQKRSQQKAGQAASEGRTSTLLTGTSPSASSAFGGRTLIGG